MKNSLSAQWKISKRSLLTLSLATVMCGAAVAQSNPLEVVRVNIVGTTTEGGIFTAIEKGYFKEQGIELKTLPGTTVISDTISQLVSGDLDIGVMNMGGPYINARTRNVPIKIILPSYVISPGEVTTGVVIRKDLIDSGRYKEAKDLKGLKLAVSAFGNTSHYTVMKAAEKAGLNTKEVELVNMPMPDTVVAMGNKAIDGAFLVEPFITVANKQNIASLKIPESENSAGLPGLLYMANQKFINDKPELVGKFVMAVLKGQRDYRKMVEAKDPQVFEILAKHGQIKDVKRLQEIQLPLASNNGEFSEAQLSALQDFLVKEKIVSKKMPLEDLYDSRFLKQALEKLGKV